MQSASKTIPVAMDPPSAPPLQQNGEQQEGKLSEWWNWITLHKHAPGTYDGSQQQPQYYQPVPQQPQYTPQYQQPPQQPQYQQPQPQYPVQYRPQYAPPPQQYQQYQQQRGQYQYQAGPVYYPGGSYSAQQSQSQR